MTAGRASALYTPELLALAVSLADHPFDPHSPFTAEARSPTCGSRVAFSAALEGAQVIEPGLRATACAVGQAAAAIFVQHARGRTRAEIAAARDAIRAWLAGSGPVPGWPSFAVLEPARAYPGRHGAIPLAWDAALAALPNQTAGS